MDPVISVIGLGYVGFPLATAFAEHFSVIGFDIDPKRIAELKNGFDRTGQIEKFDYSIRLSNDPADLYLANFHVVTVPTPIDSAKKPDLGHLISACKLVGKNLKKYDTVVFESTVYPGLTEEECLPVLEQVSGLKAGLDFYLGYSPERINPGDAQHTLSNVVKVVSGLNAISLQRISSIYAKIISAGVYEAPSIKVAEAAKVLENTQRDVNVALMNELALICHRLSIDTGQVLKAAGTKWNFLDFTPGLVGGHCIGVDPYYLTHKAEQVGYHPEVILSGRRINDQMGIFIAQQTLLQMIHQGFSIKDAKVAILGITFKENCSDIRNSRVIDIIRELSRYGIQTVVHDPIAHRQEVLDEYGIELIDWEQLPQVEAVVIAVAHDKYRLFFKEAFCEKLMPKGVVMDIKGILQPGDGLNIWRL